MTMKIQKVEITWKITLTLGWRSSHRQRMATVPIGINANDTPEQWNGIKANHDN